MQAYSTSTDTTYESWEALVEAESNGYLAVALLTNQKQTWPFVEGPFPTKREATNARTRMRNRFKKESEWQAQVTGKFFVTPAWKTERKRA
jgi:hypothetical protein